MKPPIALAAVAASLSALACIGGAGGTGGGGGGGGGTACGLDYATPNYAVETDLASGERNFFLTWPRFPVTIAVRNEVILRTPGGDVGTTGPILNGMDAWTSSSGERVAYRLLDPGAAADIVVTVQQVAAQPGAGEFLGRTNVTYDPSTRELVRAELTVRVWPGMSLQEATAGLRTTSAHEFGHALFLVGHSERPTDLMYYRGSADDDKPVQTRDLNSLLTAYCGAFPRSRQSPPSGRTKLETITFTTTAEGCHQHRGG